MKEERKKLPLYGLVILVDIKDGKDDKSESFHEILYDLGAEIAKTFNKKVNLVLFSGSNQKTINKAEKKKLPMVSPLWVQKCM